MLLDRINSFDKDYENARKVAKDFLEKKKNSQLLSKDYNEMIVVLVTLITNLCIGNSQEKCSNELSNYIILENKLNFFTEEHSKDDTLNFLSEITRLIDTRK